MDFEEKCVKEMENTMKVNTERYAIENKGMSNNHLVSALHTMNSKIYNWRLW